MNVQVPIWIQYRLRKKTKNMQMFDNFKLDTFQNSETSSSIQINKRESTLK